MGLDPLHTKLAVVEDVNRNGSIMLATTSELKKL
uniref:Putative DNA-damage repair protein n=1 Tax=Bacillus cereus VPC1401 TaxID=870739 RepID=E5AK42_BACCE|nr:putative DNA-damage repair protein [Bacillus cereus VPC1401]